MALTAGPDPDPDPDPDPSVRTSTVRKLDFVLLPFLSLLFLVNSLDRSNIGNAETAHFTRDAGLQPEDLNAAVAWFFVFFVALQPVGAAAGRKFGMSRWVPSVMTLWGVCTLLHIWVRRRWQLIMLRVILGVLEAGFYPTAVSYLSLFYTRFEFGRRLGLFYGSYGVAGALGGVIAFFVFSHFPPSEDPIDDRITPSVQRTLRPWQILFLVEGCLTIVIAIMGFFWLPRSAGTAWFLSEEEQAYAERRILIDRAQAGCQRQEAFNSTTLSDEFAEEETLTRADDEQRRRLLPDDIGTKKHPQNFSSDAGLSKSELLSTALFLPLMLPILLLNIASAVPNTGFSVFLPLVLSSLHLSSPTISNLLTAPPFLLASVFLYIFSHWSDKSRKRIIPILASLVVIALGLVLTVVFSLSPSSSTSLSPTRAVAIYFSLCVLLSGSYIPSPLTVTWLASNIPNPGKRTIILGINGYGNLAGVLASIVFSPNFQKDSYHIPFLITLGLVLVSFVGYVVLWIVIRAINNARAAATPPATSLDIEIDYAGSGRSFGVGGAEKIPAFAVVGGTWWDSHVRYWIGRRVLGMDEDDARVRRGDEILTFQYGL
ncbi:high-affinity nicotinic acid transporter [Histoplasma ohiense]|nr:high-affinity nicotinic acid transporter [Histoplasma ohiense (nom. inval.)]